MAPRSPVRPTPPPRGPALVRSTVGVLVLALGGAAATGCVKKNIGDPPMQPPPMPNPTYDDPPMPDSGMDDEGPGDDSDALEDAAEAEPAPEQE